MPAPSKQRECVISLLSWDGRGGVFVHASSRKERARSRTRTLISLSKSRAPLILIRSLKVECREAGQEILKGK